MPLLENELDIKGDCPQIVSIEMALLPICMIALDNTISEDEARTLSYYFGMETDYITLNKIAYSSSIYIEAKAPKAPAVLQILVAFDNGINEADFDNMDVSYTSILYLNTMTEIAKETKSMLRTADGKGVEFAIRYLVTMTEYIKENLNKRKQAPQENKSYEGMTLSQKNAIRCAGDYLDRGRGISKKGLIHQLSSEYGEAFPAEDVLFAIDYIETNNLVDWNKQAVLSAASYIECKGYSRKRLYDQLTSEYGGQFTPEQAEYGLKYVGY